MQHDYAEAYFNEPVNPEALGIPDYFDIIKVSCYINALCQGGRVPPCSWLHPRGMPRVQRGSRSMHCGGIAVLELTENEPESSCVC